MLSAPLCEKAVSAACDTSRQSRCSRARRGALLYAGTGAVALSLFGRMLGSYFTIPTASSTSRGSEGRAL
jgi:hypothetical protein